MITADFHERLYRKGFEATDFQRLADNLLVLQTVRRPERMGGIVMAGPDTRFESLVFVVLAHGDFRCTNLPPVGVGISFSDMETTNPLNVRVGDIVTVHNHMAAPIQPDRNLLIVDVKDVWAVLGNLDDLAAEQAADAARQATAKDELAQERLRLVQGQEAAPKRLVF